MRVMVKEKKGDDHAATTFLSVGDRLDGAVVGDGSELCGLSQEQESDLPPSVSDSN